MVVVHMVSMTLLQVVGVTTASGHVVGVLTVTNVYSATDQVVQIAGIRSDTNSKLNNTFRVTATPDSNKYRLHLQR